jgi:hypothetical protein
MFNLDTLDSLIAIVVVLLALSLVVQAIQSAIKKFFKIKSRQLEESLIDLFENVFQPVKKPAPDRFKFPNLIPFAKSPADSASPEVRTVFNAVMSEFREIGRVASSGKRMLDSVSKEDLMKILRRVGPNTLRPSFLENLEAACRQFTELEQAMAAIKSETLNGDASAKFAKLQEALSPLLNDLQCLFKKDQAGVNVGFNKNLLLADILNLREIKSADILDLLEELQAAVSQQMEKYPDNPALRELDRNLNSIAQIYVDLNKQIDEVMAPLRVKLREIENWYDTVMHSFEERYNRGMKTYAFFVGLLVAILLNANVFNVYKEVTADADKRAAILESGQAVMQRYREQLAEPEAVQNAQVEQNLKQLIATTKTEIENEAAQYAKFGFKSWAAEADSLRGMSFGKKLGHLFQMIIGWLLMATLLSIGAPFWHDTLETLFGVKNLLRKQGEIRNIETAAGAGQPRS